MLNTSQIGKHIPIQYKRKYFGTSKKIKLIMHKTLVQQKRNVAYTFDSVAKKMLLLVLTFTVALNWVRNITVMFIIQCERLSIKNMIFSS